MTIPTNFWGQIDHQLDRIGYEKAQTFSAVRDILLDPAYNQIVADVNANGPRTFGDNDAFFAGSGGDRSLLGALSAAGWEALTVHASYHWTATNAASGEKIEYIEGDLYLVQN